MATLIRDLFTGAAGVISGHTPDAGAWQNPTGFSPGMGILSLDGVGNLGLPSGYGAIQSVATYLGEEGAIEWHIYVPAAPASYWATAAVIQSSGGTTCYSLQADYGGGVYTLYWNGNDGSYPTAVFSPTTNAINSFKLEVVGGHLKCTVNGMVLVNQAYTQSISGAHALLSCVPVTTSVQDFWAYDIVPTPIFWQTLAQTYEVP